MTNKPRDMYAAKRDVPFNNHEMELMCGVSAMTLYNWQHGSPTKAPLHVKRLGRSVRYPVKSTLAWLRKHEVAILIHPDDLATAAVTASVPAVKKPGPKPRAVAILQATHTDRPSAR